MLSGNFKGSEIWHGFFLGGRGGGGGGGEVLVREFFEFCWNPLGSFWVFIFAPIQSSVSLEIRSTPRPPGSQVKL